MSEMFSDTPEAIAQRARYAYIKAHRPAAYKAILANAATYRHPSGLPAVRPQTCFCDTCHKCKSRLSMRAMRELRAMRAALDL